jgi:type I restriction enzyme S subunit
MSKYPQGKFGDVATEISRLVTLETGVAYRSVGVKWYGEGVHVHETRQGHEFDADRFEIQTDDLIYNDMWARMGSVAIVPPELSSSVASSHFPTFKLNREIIEPRYLHWFFKTPSFWEECETASRGSTGRNQIKRRTFLAIPIPLPSLAEQRRVVARIEELAAQIHEARTLRHQATEEAEALSYSSLKQARHRLLNSKHPKSRLGALTKVTSGGTPSRGNPAFWNGDIPWIKTGELLDGDISNAQEHITQDAVDNSSARLFPPETVLIALYGQGQTRGRTGRLLISATTNQACCAVLPKPEMFEARFIQYWLRSLYVELREEAQGGAQPNWNGGMIKDLEIALPPLAEQRRIVVELDALQAEVDALKRLQAETAAELDALLPAILDRAFKGLL